MKNTQLKRKYDQVYKKGSGSFYSFSSFPESKAILDAVPDWRGLKVLEIGCGEGRLAAMIGFAGAERVDAVDYSREAIKIAKERLNIPGVNFLCSDYKKMRSKYDVVVLQGVLEHLDKPFRELGMVLSSRVKAGGTLITSSPSFINPRGYVWMTLLKLFDVPMSLSDLHYLCPFDFEDFAQKKSCDIEITSSDQDWGGGERTIIDFKRRLPNALRDAGMRTDKVDELIAWLDKAVRYHGENDFTGANVIYKLTKRARRKTRRNTQKVGEA